MGTELVKSDRFAEIVGNILDLHIRKAQDYGSEGDPYANVRASAEFGIEPWVGAALRLNDKVQRLKSMVQKGRLVNESILDSFDDIAVYAVIARVLYEEAYEEASDREILPDYTDYVFHRREHADVGAIVDGCYYCKYTLQLHVD